MLIVDNSEYGGDILDQIEKEISKKLKNPIKNPLGKRWINDNTGINRFKNRPS
jgi:hypothetical protein